jgi:hypothetical protein
MNHPRGRFIKKKIILIHLKGVRRKFFLSVTGLFIALTFGLNQYSEK